MAILTGESLINDAAALTLFSIAVAQVAGTQTFIENPFLLFGYSATVGPLVGAAIGYATVWLRARLDNPGLETVQGFLVPFAAFIAAEELHASGVLAVVVAGFVVGNGAVGAGYQTRLQERYVWSSLDVLLEAFVFAYIGLHLRFVLEHLNEAHESLAEVAVASLVVLLIVLVIRPLSVFVMFGRNKLFRHVESKLNVPDRDPDKPLGKWRAKIDNRSLSWRENVVVSWTGMRGVVTLAAAAAIPVTTASGEPFPERATVQAIAFVVSVGTLLIQGSSLPLLIRRLHLSRFSDDHEFDRGEELKAERVVHDAAEQVLGEFRANPPVGMNPELITQISATIARHSQDADEMPDPDAHTKLAEVFSRVYRDVLAAQRAALIAERDTGHIEDEAVRAMLERLDLQEAGVSARLDSRF